MAKIKVRVKPGQVLSLVDGEHKAGTELMMEEKDAEPILDSCISRVSIKKKKKLKPTSIKPAFVAGKDKIPKDEEETVSG